jgi:starch-binding outer membrane protein, SusD/RagB family
MKDATDEEKKLIAGQLYFFRGWFHFMLLQYWGGLPYVDKVLPTDETPKLPRLNYQQTAEKVSADLLKAAELLPVDWDQTAVGAQTSGRNNFRANKIMAMAFHAKNLLLAGSPLMDATTKGLPPSSASTSDYNKEYCKRAAAAFAETLKLIESTGRYQLAQFSDYSKLFYTVNQGNATPGLKESIFIENTAEHNNRFALNQVNDYRPFKLIPQGIKCHPTANYIDNYGMANGMPLPADITKPDPESGWDPEYPWKNRDPRFYNDIIIDGEKLINNGGAVQNNEYDQYASMFTNGKQRVDQGSGGKQFYTGYMLTKFEARITNDFENTKGAITVDLALLRLADVYLMYAEAVSEGYNSPTANVSGYGLSAVDAINKIRDRAGVGHVGAKFLTSQDAFRPEYRRERAVELAFEGHRFVDLRRWLLLTKRPYTLKNSVEFLRAIPNAQVYADPRNARVSNFSEKIIFERQYSDKHYWFPFQVKDVSLYAEFTQNPGW